MGGVADEVNGAAIFYVEKSAIDNRNGPVLLPKPTRFFQTIPRRPKPHSQLAGLVIKHQHVQVLPGVKQRVDAGFAPDKAGF